MSTFTSNNFELNSKMYSIPIEKAKESRLLPKTNSRTLLWMTQQTQHFNFSHSNSTTHIQTQITTISSQYAQHTQQLLRFNCLTIHYHNSYIYRHNFSSVFILLFCQRLIYRRDHRRKCSTGKTFIINFWFVGKSVDNKKILLLINLLTEKAR